MTDWKSKLKEAKALVDEGLMSPEKYAAIQEQAYEGMGLYSETPSGASVKNQLGAYHLISPIGMGGMGEVHRGRHSNESIANTQGGDVAIKKMHSQYAKNPDYRDRFHREASFGLELKHPGIVKVFDLVQDGEDLALVMELAQGIPLSKKIGKEVGPIPWEDAYPLFGKILDAVKYAHEHEVVHRDIKPENIIVSPDGDIKILDFGIAKDLNKGKTKTSTGMGTVDYMAPEQYADAKRVDQRADIYALGMTLYEMLAGRLPWEESLSEFQILKLKDGGELPPPTYFYPHIPQPVVAEIFKATARSAAERHASVEAFIQAFDDAHNSLGQSIVANPPDEVKGDMIPEPIVEHDEADEIETMSIPPHDPVEQTVETVDADNPTDPDIPKEPTEKLTPTKPAKAPASRKRILIGLTLFALFVFIGQNQSEHYANINAYEDTALKFNVPKPWFPLSRAKVDEFIQTIDEQETLFERLHALKDEGDAFQLLTPEPMFTVQSIDAYESSISVQKDLQKRVEDVRPFAEDLIEPSLPFSKEAVEEYESSVQSIRLENRVTAVASKAKVLGLETPKNADLTEEVVQSFEMETNTQYQLYQRVETLAETAKKLGIEQPKPPYDDATVKKYEVKVDLANRADVLTDKAVLFQIVQPTQPLTEEKVALFEDKVAIQNGFHTRVEQIETAATKHGIAKPTIPYAEWAVKEYESQHSIYSSRRFAAVYMRRGWYHWNTGFRYESEVKESVLNSCQSAKKRARCKLLLSTHQCFSVYDGDKSVWYVDESKKKAKRRARSKCNRRYDYCKHIVTKCAGD